MSQGTSKKKRSKETKSVEISSAKHKKYKLHAVKNDTTIKDLVEEAVDLFLEKK